MASLPAPQHGRASSRNNYTGCQMDQSGEPLRRLILIQMEAARQQAVESCAKMETLLKAVLAERKNRILRMVDRLEKSLLAEVEDVQVQYAAERVQVNEKFATKLCSKTLSVDGSKAFPREMVESFLKIPLPQDVLTWTEKPIEHFSSTSPGPWSLENAISKTLPAAFQGDLNFFKTLYDYCCLEKWTPEQLRKLVEQQRDSSEEQHTALHSAAFRGHLDVVRFLVERFDADVFVRTAQTKSTPAHQAAKFGRLDVVKYLVSREPALCEALDFQDKILLHDAGFKGHLETVEFLITKTKINLEAKSIAGRTVLHTASIPNGLAIVSLLISQGANVEAKDKSNRTALHLAAGHGCVDVVRFLAEGYPHLVPMTDSKGQTALDVALRFKHCEVEKLLLEAGKSVSTAMYLQSRQTKNAEKEIELARSMKAFDIFNWTS